MCYVLFINLVPRENKYNIDITSGMQSGLKATAHRQLLLFFMQNVHFRQYSCSKCHTPQLKDVKSSAIGGQKTLCASSPGQTAGQYCYQCHTCIILLYNINALFVNVSCLHMYTSKITKGTIFHGYFLWCNTSTWLIQLCGV